MTFRLTFFVFSLLLLGGCSTQRIPGPAVSLVNVRVDNVSLLNTEVQCSVRLENRTPEDLVIHGATYAITLNGTELGTGTADDTIELPRLSRHTQTVHFALSNWSFIEKIAALVKAARFEYELTAEFYLDRAGLRRAHTANRGILDLGVQHNEGAVENGAPDDTALSHRR